MSNQIQMPITVKGHCKIVDDLGNVLLDKPNAIHPQNMARIIARSLANEPHTAIHRIAFGNGGTSVDAAFSVTYKTPNDGQSPDISTWESRLYNETYSEIIDEGQTTLNPLLGTDPGSADSTTGVRPGGGAVPSSDPPSVLHTSGPGVRSAEMGIISEVTISCTLNKNEPRGQFTNDSTPVGTETDFVFDEIGLYTEGASAIDTSGYQQVSLGNAAKTASDVTGLVRGQMYSFNVSIDGIQQLIVFTPPVGGPASVTYGQLCQALNTDDTSWNISPTGINARFLITDPSQQYESLTSANTSGYLVVQSNTAGALSSINLAGSQTSLFLSLLSPPQGASLLSPVSGIPSGVANDPLNPSLQRERLLTHLVFSPVLKSANRTLSITYTITISLPRTASQMQ